MTEESVIYFVAFLTTIVLLFLVALSLEQMNKLMCKTYLSVNGKSAFLDETFLSQCQSRISKEEVYDILTQS